MPAFQLLVRFTSCPLQVQPHFSTIYLSLHTHWHARLPGNRFNGYRIVFRRYSGPGG